MIPFKATVTALDVLMAFGVAVFSLRKSDEIALWFVFGMFVLNGVAIWL